MSFHPRFIPYPPPPAGRMVDTKTVRVDSKKLYHWRFLQFAMLDLYHISSEQTSTIEFVNMFNENAIRNDHYLTEPWSSQSVGLMRAFENALCAKFSIATNANLWEHFQRATSWDNIRWSCSVTFNKHDPLCLKYEVEHLLPQVEQCTNLYSHYLSSDRFLFVYIAGLVSPTPIDEQQAVLSQYWKQHWAQIELFKKGIVFGGRRYVFLGGEMEKNIGKSHHFRSLYQANVSSSSSSSSSNKSIDRCLVAWFVAVENIFSSVKTLYTTIPLHFVRNYFGHLTALPSGKCNARIKLGFSFAFPMEIAESNIVVVQDILGDTGCVMTDGCGLISADLVKSIPYAVNHGAVRGNMRTEYSPLPSIIQVRCVSRKGLFKGCLIVTADTKLCPAGNVIFRESMRKSEGSPVHVATSMELIQDLETIPISVGDEWILETKQKAILGVVDTFEHPALLTKDSQREMSDFKARLNRSLCLLLAYLGVKRDNLLAMMQGEIDQLSSDGNTTEDAFRLARSCLINIRQDGANWYERAEIDDDEETDNTTVGGDGAMNESLASVSTLMMNKSKICDPIYTCKDQVLALSQANGRLIPESLAEKIIHFVDAGHNVDEEPYFLQLYNRLKLQKYKFLSRCNVSIRNAIYLVGAPDPYQFLEPGEVFILPPNDRVDVRRHTSFTRCPVVKSKVAVTRHPMQHPGDIRVFAAVEHPLLMQLSRMPELTSGGVIFFSTKGIRAPGDEMSGGDYDGDRYLVLFGEQIVDFARPVPANSEEVERELLKHVIVEQPATMSEELDQATANCATSQSIPRNCSCQVCVDPLGCTIFRRLLTDAQEQNVGRYSNAWLAFADADPMCREALLCGYIVRIALDAAKSGKRVRPMSDLLSKAPRLRHLRDEIVQNETLAGVEVSSSSNSRYVGGTEIDELMSNEEFFDNDPEEWRWMDEDKFGAETEELLLEEELLYNFNELHIAVGRSSLGQIAINGRCSSSSLSTSTTTRRSTMSSSSKSVIQEMFEMVTKAIPTSPVQITTRSKLQIDWDLLIVEDDLPEHNKYEFCALRQDVHFLRERIFQIFPKFHVELQEWHCRVREYKNAFWKLFLVKEKAAKNTTSIDNTGKSLEVAGQEIRLAHMQLFDKASVEFAKKFTVSDKVARLRLAGIVYLATYFNASQTLDETMAGKEKNRRVSHQQLSHNKSATLNYCWDICGHELHYNKKQMEKRKQHQPALQTILRSVTYML